MSRRILHPFGILVLALMALAAPKSAEAVDLDRWNADRAHWFSSVCMASAPSFAEMKVIAKASGFQLNQGNLMHAPEVSVSLQNADGHCACYMTMGAYDPTKLVQAIFEQLLQDFPDSWRPVTNSGAVNDTRFTRDGELVRLLLTPHKLEGNDWIAGRVISAGSCPV